MQGADLRHTLVVVRGIDVDEFCEALGTVALAEPGSNVGWRWQRDHAVLQPRTDHVGEEGLVHLQLGCNDGSG